MPLLASRQQLFPPVRPNIVCAMKTFLTNGHPAEPILSIPTRHSTAPSCPEISASKPNCTSKIRNDHGTPSRLPIVHLPPQVLDLNVLTLELLRLHPAPCQCRHTALHLELPKKSGPTIDLLPFPSARRKPWVISSSFPSLPSVPVSVFGIWLLVVRGFLPCLRFGCGSAALCVPPHPYRPHQNVDSPPFQARISDVF